MLYITAGVSISDSEIELSAVRSQGPGGQNVNKVSSAIHLRFDVRQSSLPALFKQRLLKLSDQRISKDGVIVIKAQTTRSQEKNRQEALDRLVQLLVEVSYTPKVPSVGAWIKRPNMASRSPCVQKSLRTELISVNSTQLS